MKYAMCGFGYVEEIKKILEDWGHVLNTTVIEDGDTTTQGPLETLTLQPVLDFTRGPSNGTSTTAALRVILSTAEIKEDDESDVSVYDSNEYKEYSRCLNRHLKELASKTDSNAETIRPGSPRTDDGAGEEKGAGEEGPGEEEGAIDSNAETIGRVDD